MADARSENGGSGVTGFRSHLSIAPACRGVFPYNGATMTTLILFNKPYGVICQFSGQGAPNAKTPATARPTLKDFLPQRDVYPAGRLDTDSEGLVVLTADGTLQHRITDPRHKLPKTYFAEVEGAPSATALHQLRSGIQLGEFRALPAQVRWVEPPTWLWPRVPPVRFRKHIPTSWLEITLKEGKNRQVRHMTAAAGCPTLRLIRYRIGDWTLADLAPGQWRQLALETSASRPVPAKKRSNSPSKQSTTGKRPR